MQNTINTPILNFSATALIAIANAISADIDRLGIDSQSMREVDYRAVNKQLNDDFDAVCAALRDMGVDVESTVSCPAN